MDVNSLKANGKHYLPGIWEAFLPGEFWELKLPEERRSSCSSCPKVALAGYPQEAKCCTYFPRIPNYAVGLALKSNSHRALAEKVLGEGRCLPDGLHCSPGEWVEFQKGSSEVRCWFLDQKTGMCGAYPYRNGVCSTFFCLCDHGPGGDVFWQAVQDLVLQIETALSQWALTQAGFSVPALMTGYNEFAQDLWAYYDPDKKTWNERARKRLFGDWFGREKELLLTCAQVVEDACLSPGDLFHHACEQTILEPVDFEKSLVAELPGEFQEKLDQNFLVQGKAARIEDLWYEVLLCHRNLWAVPFGEGGVLRLNPEARVVDRMASDDGPFERYYEEFNFFVTLIEVDEQGKRQHWRQAISDQEANALRLFTGADGQELDESLLAEPCLSALEDTRGFLSEWLRKNILQWVI